jgi:hypothetical protein
MGHIYPAGHERVKINYQFTTNFIVIFIAAGCEGNFVRDIRYKVHVTKRTTFSLAQSTLCMFTEIQTAL